MQGLDTRLLATPVQQLLRLGHELGVELWVKRDDLCPIPGGGAKIRKLVRILREAPEIVNALVTTGGVQSNHARVVALVAAQYGMRCELVLHGDSRVLENPTGNLLLMLLSGARVNIVPSDSIGEALDSAVDSLRREGYIPLMIEGGGHSVEGALGLTDAVVELDSQLPTPDWRPDFIVHASGTGGTQAGILAGVDLLGWPTRVIGISVARQASRGRAVVAELYEQARSKLQLQERVREIDFRDNWIGDGYGHALPGAVHLIRDVASLEGVPLDPTYTSKAMRGLIDLVNQGVIPRGSRVLFWHTGGLLNLMSAEMEWGLHQ